MGSPRVSRRGAWGQKRSWRHPAARARGPAPLAGERRHGRTQASLKMAVTIGKLLKIGTSGPINAGGNGPQRATRASDTGFGREDAICEYIEIMQIPPRFE